MPATRRLILASTSRYRRELLERLRLPFTVEFPGVVETPMAGESPDALARRLALAKADAVAARQVDAVVIGSDQVADLAGTLLGKPGSHERAVGQLLAMSGKTVVFHSGIAVVCRSMGFSEVSVATVTVHVRTLSQREIERYLALDEPYDCAGSAKSEALGIALLDAIESDDPTALVGLPLIRTAALLRRAGIDPLGDRDDAMRLKPTVTPGRLLLVPNTLDFGIAGDAPDLQDVLPLGVIRQAAALRHWVCENAKTTRAFLKRVDAVVTLSASLQSLTITELPRAPKGRPSTTPDLKPLLAPALAGLDLGLMSEAGLPAVADPGALLVAAAHVAGVSVVPLAGASSLLLALAASGLNGQSFAFVGYLPVDGTARDARIRELETWSQRTAQTQLIIETPYRNEALLAALLATLKGTTELAVSAG